MKSRITTHCTEIDLKKTLVFSRSLNITNIKLKIENIITHAARAKRDFNSREFNAIELVERSAQSPIDVIFIIGKILASCLRKSSSHLIQSMKIGTLQNNQGRRTMRPVVYKILTVTMIAVISLSEASAEGIPKLDIKIDDQKINFGIVDQAGQEITSYSPGDTLRYVITASNVGDGLMTDPAIVDPIPAGVTYIPNTARGDDADISFSINQGNSYMPWPPYYTVRNSKGILIKRQATADMVSHIKWDISRDLKPAENSNLEFLVVVNR